MKQEDIIKKAEEIVNQGKFGSLSDYEVTTHVALETAKWAEKVMLDKVCDYLYNTLYTRANGAEHYVASKEKITQTEFVNSLRKAMGAKSKRKRVNMCPSYDKDWGCAISPMKQCSGCPNSEWRYIYEE